MQEQTLRATGDPVVPKRARRRARQRRHGLGLGDRHRARCRTATAPTVVGTDTFGKGVFQEVLELSNGGALDITAGQYFTPKGRNLGGRGVDRARGIMPDVRAQDNPKTRRDEALDKALAGRGRPKCPS